MPVTVVVGAQWGDEGKGRIVDFLAGQAAAVGRFGGGPNAGHTVKVGGATYKLRVVPSGIAAGVEHCIIGPGVVFSPAGLIRELDALIGAGIDTSVLRLSDLAHVILPYHVALDADSEKALGVNAVGTTGNGIAPAYVDRVARRGLRAGDLFDMQAVHAVIARRAAELRHQAIDVDLGKLMDELRSWAVRLLPYACDTVTLLHKVLREGRRVIAEGAQGTLLDVGLGTYPYVTSSVTVAGGAASGLGFGPSSCDAVIGVAKAYATRVGAGPFPSEDQGAAGERLRSKGAEYGVVTGRPRRCGWLDLAALKYAVAVNGITHLALTKLDVLDGFDSVQLCIDYVGQESRSLPQRLMAGVRPVYERLPGWPTCSSHAREWAALPENAKKFVEHVERLTGVPVAYISVGPERTQIIVRSGAPLGSSPLSATCK